MKRHRLISSSPSPSPFWDRADCLATNSNPADEERPGSAAAAVDRIAIATEDNDDNKDRCHNSGILRRSVGCCDPRPRPMHKHKHKRRALVLAGLLLVVLGIRLVFLFLLHNNHNRLGQGQGGIGLSHSPPSANSAAARTRARARARARTATTTNNNNNNNDPSNPGESTTHSGTTRSTFFEHEHKKKPQSQTQTVRNYWLNSTTLDSMVKNHAEPDVAWYRACARNHAARWIQNMRSAGGTSQRFYTRACNGTGLHPQGIHWDPFHTVSHNCSVTSRVKIEVVRDHRFDDDNDNDNDNDNEDWKLVTYDSDGNAKTLGGDTFYVVYSEYRYVTGTDTKHSETTPLLPTAVGIPTDYYNGTYGLTFVTVPFLDHHGQNTNTNTNTNGKRHTGRLTVYPITTCFIGELYAPLKDGWKTGGATNVSWTIEDLERPLRIQDWYADRYLPAQHAAEQKQQQQQQQQQPQTQQTLNRLWDFDRVLFFGDSITQLMVWDFGSKNYHAILREKIQSGKVWVPNTSNSNGNGRVVPDKTDVIAAQGGPVNVNLPLSPATLSEYISVLESSVREGLGGGPNAAHHNSNNSSSSNNNNQSIALVLGSAAWDVIWPAEWQGPTFDSHLSAVTDLVRHVLTFSEELFPSTSMSTVTVVWKLPYANHLHRADPQRCFADPGVASDGGACTKALKYATAERFENLYSAQKRLFATSAALAGNPRVRVLDLYEVSYLSGAHWMMPNDSIHYQPFWNARILDLLYRQH